jgi:transposase
MHSKVKRFLGLFVKQVDQKLTAGLDLGDRSSWYCMLDEAGEVIHEQKLSATPKAMK